MDDVFLTVVARSSLVEIQKLCSINRNYNALCKKYRNYIAKIQLEKHKVDYKNPGNLIYKISSEMLTGPIKQSLKKYYTGIGYDPNRSLYDIFKLYQKFTYAKYIDCSGKDVTSIPELLELEYLNCSTPTRYPRITGDYGKLNLPEPSSLPKLKALICSNNQLTSLPEYLNLTVLDCSHNKLTSIPKYPNLTYLDCSNNQLTSLPMYPELTTLIFSNNQISSLLTYPKLFMVESAGNP